MFGRKSAVAEAEFTSSAVITGLERSDATIVLDHVSKWYGDIVAVSDVSFAIGAGVTGLLGPNGAGKSTALKMMAGLQAPSNGNVTIDSLPARGNPMAYRNLGLVSEHEVIYPF